MQSHSSARRTSRFQEVVKLLGRAAQTGKDPRRSLLGRRLVTQIPLERRTQFFADMRAEDLAKLVAHDALLEAWAGAF